MKRCDVTVLGSESGCPKCSQLKRMMKKDDFDYFYIDISEDDAKSYKQQMIEAGVREIPAIFVNDVLFGTGVDTYKRMR